MPCPAHPCSAHSASHRSCTSSTGGCGCSNSAAASWSSSWLLRRRRPASSSRPSGAKQEARVEASSFVSQASNECLSAPCLLASPQRCSGCIANLPARFLLLCLLPHRLRVLLSRRDLEGQLASCVPDGHCESPRLPAATTPLAPPGIAPWMGSCGSAASSTQRLLRGDSGPLGHSGAGSVLPSTPGQSLGSMAGGIGPYLGPPGAGSLAPSIFGPAQPAPPAFILSPPQFHTPLGRTAGESGGGGCSWVCLHAFLHPAHVCLTLCTHAGSYLRNSVAQSREWP